MTGLTVEPTAPADREQVLQILFQAVPADQRDVSVAKAQALFKQGELDAQDLLAARHRGRLVGAMLAHLAPGAVGWVWPPQAVPGPNRQAIEDALVQAACLWLRSHGVKVVQALLPPEEKALGIPLERNGLTRVTCLQFLRHPLGPQSPKPADSRLTFESYGPQTRDLFEQTLLRTYEGTQDCPELSGVRSLDEIITGHQAQGDFNPQRWWLAKSAGQPIGILLVNTVPEWQAWEVIYMGVVPEVRGRGFGQQLIAKALTEARHAGARYVTLSVDRRNTFAQRVYRQLGFELWDQREVYLAVYSCERRVVHCSCHRE